MSFIFDAHLDLAMNAIEWNRDLTQPVSELRRREAGKTDKPDRGRGTVSLPDMRRAGIGLCVATQIARVDHDAWSPVFGWRSQAQAWAMTQGQLAWYRAMEEAAEMVPIRDRAGLERHLALWNAENAEQRTPNAERQPTEGRQPNTLTQPLRQTSNAERHDPDNERRTTNNEQPTTNHEPRTLPVGYILSLEGADSLFTPRHLERSFADGLRAIGPAHYGPGVYAFGTDATGGFPARGKELLREISRLGLILDVTHLSDECFWEALDLHQGPLWASHQNCRALVPHMRQFSDEQFRALIARGAVIGCALDAWMLVPGWVRGQTTPQSSGVTLQHFIDHIDHICQLAGNANHTGIGTDLDGAFGTEQSPQDLDTIADLTKVPALLSARGYSASEISGIVSGNFIRFLREAWT
jgi:membrane dipeptidase